MMIRSLWTGCTGMRAMQFNIDSISHDLANVNTQGYKKRHVNMEDLFYQKLRAAGLQGSQQGNNIPVGIHVGHGVRIAGTTPVMTPGTAFETNIPTDMMIQDDAYYCRNFFRVLMPDGSFAYTRDGSFRVGDDGLLANADGYYLDPLPGEIPDDAVAVQITAEGSVQYRVSGETDWEEAGLISLFTFVNPAGLEPMGDNLWRESPASGEPTEGDPGTVGFGTIKGGWVEMANVDAVTEMVNMISAQRAYEFNSRSIQTSDEMLQTIVSLKR